MLNVVFASNDEYSPFLLIAIQSLIENNKNDFDHFNIFVLDDGITNSNKTKIQKSIDEDICSLNFIDTVKLDNMGFKISGIERNLNKTSLTTYARLFISSLIPKDIDKIIYMDCDALIVGSFKDLWNLDITEYYCAAVLDGINTSVKEKLGFKKEEDYINAGFLLVNLKKWRCDEVEDKFIQFLIANQYKFYQNDQGVLNNIFKNKIKIIPPKYNLQSYFQILSYDLARKYICMVTDYYNKEIVDESRLNPIFLHFCGLNYDRPWYNKDHPYAKLFLSNAKKVDCEYVIDYLDEIPFKYRMFYKGVNNKLINLLLKLIPGFFVRKIINKNALRQIEEENKMLSEQ